MKLIKLLIIFNLFLFNASMSAFSSATLLVQGNKHILILGEIPEAGQEISDMHMQAFVKKIEELNKIKIKIVILTNKRAFNENGNNLDSAHKILRKIGFKSQIVEFVPEEVPTDMNTAFLIADALILEQGGLIGKFLMLPAHKFSTFSNEILVCKKQDLYKEFTLAKYYQLLDSQLTHLKERASESDSLVQQFSTEIESTKKIFSSLKKTTSLYQAIISSLTEAQTYPELKQKFMQLGKLFDNTAIAYKTALVFGLGLNKNLYHEIPKNFIQTVATGFRNIEQYPEICTIIGEYWEETDKVIYIVREPYRHELMQKFLNNGFTIQANISAMDKNIKAMMEHPGAEFLDIRKFWTILPPVLNTVALFLHLPTKSNILNITKICEKIAKLDPALVKHMQEKAKKVQDSVSAHGKYTAK